MPAWQAQGLLKVSHCMLGATLGETAAATGAQQSRGPVPGLPRCALEECEDQHSHRSCRATA